MMKEKRFWGENMKIDLFEKVETPVWYFVFILFGIIFVGFVAFNTGYSFHENSVGLFFSEPQEDCWTKAFVLEAFSPFDLTSNLKQKECNSINWLWEKRIKWGKDLGFLK